MLSPDSNIIILDLRRMGWSWKIIALYLHATDKQLYLHREKFHLEEPFRVVQNQNEAREIVGPMMAENPQCGERVLRGRLLALGLHMPRSLWACNSDLLADSA